MKNIHRIQLNILRTLLFAESKRYSEIKPTNMESSQFKYHLDALITAKLITKDANGHYLLTPKGKEFANQMDSINIQMKKQTKVTAKICCIRDSGLEPEYLLYERLKNPFFGHQGFPTSKIWYGMSFVEGAQKGLYNETNLIGEPELIAIRHYRVYDEISNTLLEDKTMYIFKIINPTGELQSRKDGRFKWVKETKVNHFVKKSLPEFREVFSVLNNNNTDFFKEVVHKIDINKF